MSKVSTYSLAFAACLGGMAMLGAGTSDVTPISNNNMEARLGADGAFRDGLYLGKLAAQAGEPMRPAVGRWSAERDRASSRLDLRVDTQIRWRKRSMSPIGTEARARRPRDSRRDAGATRRS
jgi:hypothetical protein